MNVLDLGHLEAQFGLIIREKENHNNYALLRFEDLDKVVEYYKSFKDNFENSRDLLWLPIEDIVANPPQMSTKW